MLVSIIVSNGLQSVNGMGAYEMLYPGHVTGALHVTYRMVKWYMINSTATMFAVGHTPLNTPDPI